jgi:flagellar FliL protein
MVKEEAEVKEESGKKIKLPLKWIIVAIAAVTILSGGVLGYILLKPSPAAQDPKPPSPVNIGKTDSRNGELSQIIPLESFVVNLNDPGGKRYLKTTISLESSNKGFSEEVQAENPRIKDAVVMILSSKSLADIQGIEGKISLRKELIIKINTILQKTRIRNLYFTDFYIQ